MGFDDLSLFNAGAQTFNRTYTYDSLNRLLTLSAPGDPCSGLSWTYDAWGNRTDQNVTGGTCNSFHQLVDTKNRLSGAGYQYDAAGNMTNDGSHSYSYDAENRIISVDGGSAIYVYDAQGHRVRKITGSTWTDYVYDASGNVVTEFTSQQGACGPICWTTSYIYMNGHLVAEYKDGTTYFVHKDHLGSTRLLSKMDRTLKDWMDFLPYGEQIAGDTGTTHKFTGKERDSESNLDYFGARYYSSAMGRFMSPDWDGKPATVPYAAFGDPQSLNLYAYVRNSPIVRIDADGHNYAGWNGAYADTSGGMASEVLGAMGQTEHVSSGTSTVTLGLTITYSETGNSVTYRATYTTDSATAHADAAAWTQNTGQGSSQGSSAAGPALRGPFVADLQSPAIAPLLGPNHTPSDSEVVGDGECVALTKEFSGMGDVSAKHHWYQGEKVSDAKGIKPGTAIANFNDKGRYPSEHRWNSGIYLGPGTNGTIWILDQWPGHSPRPREVLLNNRREPADNAGAYSVILTGPWR